MAGLDYYNCDSCGRGKLFYDANVDWEGFGHRIGQIKTICTECFNDGVRIQIVNSKTTEDHNPGVSNFTSEGKL